MIDIESDVVAQVQTNVRTSYPSLTVYSEYLRKPASFPHVTLIEMSNTSYMPTATSGYANNHARLMFSMEVFSNKRNGKKAEAEHIANLVDETMIGLGFARTMKQPIANLEDATIYRIVARYQAVVSESGTIHPI